MPSSYRVYIDESGDEGFKFLPNEQGSSRWFVLSAVVVRTERDLQLVQLAKDVRALLHKEPKHALHFRFLKHEQRMPFARRIGEAPIRHIHVLVHKPSIADPENFQQEKFSLYRYATRLLLERVSWLCRDHYRPGDAGDGRAELIFSNRSAMSYADLREYLRRLQALPEVRIHWDSVDPDAVRAVAHEQLAGLQIADAVATGAFYAVHRSVYGETEEGYLRLMAGNLYRNRGTPDGYGLKFWCDDIDEKQRVIAIVTR
ncbi:conserved hypothetical protein [Paraburkholderia unamae]|uniref:DUF3800 domain-containing protein n=1 Tax=Paraburkholderia unamae TaxID=219649 RepID=UPI001CAAD5EB|nr:DUF3800 domain-containing protein [Paraburkholderia unamae]CAG9268310.1 conserved hypothetical protein [Paraburkholderia unamae]